MRGRLLRRCFRQTTDRPGPVRGGERFVFVRHSRPIDVDLSTLAKQKRIAKLPGRARLVERRHTRPGSLGIGLHFGAITAQAHEMNSLLVEKQPLTGF